MGVRWRIGSLFGLNANRARNRTAIRTQIRTRVDGPLPLFKYHQLPSARILKEENCAKIRKLTFTEMQKILVRPTRHRMSEGQEIYNHTHTLHALLFFFTLSYVVSNEQSHLLCPCWALISQVTTDVTESCFLRDIGAGRDKDFAWQGVCAKGTEIADESSPPPAGC
jgi:hypothetical protein